MKKLMIGLVGALAIVASADVVSENVVGYKNKSISLDARAMCSAATFVKSGENPIDIKISDIKQTVGDPGDLVLCLYDDNVTCQAQFWYITPEVAEAEEDFEVGWYKLDSDGDLDIEAGVQNDDLPLGQGCVIESSNPDAEFVSAGEVDSIVREFSVDVDARKMMGNILPKPIMLSELKQTVGDPGDFVLCTYDDNVTCQAQYWYITPEVAADEDDLEVGWYRLDGDGDLDIEAGVQNFEIQSGDGFVIESSNADAVLQFPKAM